jgi:putative endonuclease
MTKTDPRKLLGDLGESIAAEHLQRRGFSIVARQHRTRFGEIDLIAFDGTTLAFCEVKTRRSATRVWDALGGRKRQQVRRMAAAYLAETRARPRAREVRFDAIGVVIDSNGSLISLDHIEDAF